MYGQIELSYELYKFTTAMMGNTLNKGLSICTSRGPIPYMNNNNKILGPNSYRHGKMFYISKYWLK